MYRLHALLFCGVKSGPRQLANRPVSLQPSMTMISSDLIQHVSGTLYERALQRIPVDTHRALEKARDGEPGESARRTLMMMVESADTAERDRVLVCSDVGIPVYSVKVGTRARLEGPLREAITRGYEAFLQRMDPPILKMVTHPLTHARSHTGRDIPILSFDMVDGDDGLDIVCAPKAMGSGRWEELKTFVYPTMEEIESYVLEVVVRAGSQPCPPIIVGVGIGGSFDHAARLAKQQVLRPIGEAHPEPAVAAMEARLLAAVNALGFGPMGLGGQAGAMAVHVDYAGSHGFMPVAVALNCWINRRTAARIDAGGHVQWRL